MGSEPLYHDLPGLALRPLGGLETTQLLHLLWQGERALDEWNEPQPVGITLDGRRSLDPRLVLR